MPVDRDQAHMLAALAVACRPHGAAHWDAPGVVAAISRVKHLQLADVAVAVFQAAADRSLRTPAPIGITSSPCWTVRVAEPTARRHATRAESCARCAQVLTDTCCDQPTARPVSGAARRPDDFQEQR